MANIKEICGKYTGLERLRTIVLYDLSRAVRYPFPLREASRETDGEPLGMMGTRAILV